MTGFRIPVLAGLLLFALSCSSGKQTMDDKYIDMHPYQDFGNFRGKVLRFAYAQGKNVSDYYQEIIITDVNGIPDRMIVNAYIGTDKLRLDSTNRYFWKKDALVSESWVYYGANNEKRDADLPGGGFIVFPARLSDKTDIKRVFAYSVYNSEFGWLNYTAEMGLRSGGFQQISVMGVKMDAVVIIQDITWTIKTDSGMAYGPNHGTWYYYYVKPYGYVRGDFSNSEGRSTIMELRAVISQEQFNAIKNGSR